MSLFVRQNSMLLRFFICFSVLIVWIAGSFFVVAPIAQMQVKNANAKKIASSTPKKATPKPTAKPATKTTPKAAAKTTPKPSPKATPKTTPKATPKAVAKTTPTPKPSPKQTPKPSEPRFITTAFSVNLRESASSSAAGTGQINVGTVVRSLERSNEKQTIGGKSDYWRRISANGKEGWIFGGFLRQFDTNKRETIYKQLAADRARAAGKNFDDNVELYDFLSRIAPELKTPSIAAELGLARLLALKTALAAIPFDKQSESQYKSFTTAQSENVVYSEPSGEWLVRSELFWNLAKKYRTLPIAEKIAWTAAQNPLPGECEGYLNCYLYFLKSTYGTYLEQFPRGSHTTESLKAISDMLTPIVADASKKEIYSPPSDVSDRAEFYQTIADLRVVISKTGYFEKDAVLKQLNQVAEGYR